MRETGLRHDAPPEELIFAAMAAESLEGLYLSYK
jgi:hypothetical protein